MGVGVFSIAPRHVHNVPVFLDQSIRFSNLVQALAILVMNCDQGNLIAAISRRHRRANKRGARTAMPNYAGVNDDADKCMIPRLDR